MCGLLGRLEAQRQAVPRRRLGGGSAQGIEQLLLGLDHGDDSTYALPCRTRHEGGVVFGAAAVVRGEPM